MIINWERTLWSRVIKIVLVCSGGCNKNTLDYMAHKQQKFISYSLDAGESKSKLLADSVSGENLFLGSQMAISLLCLYL